MHVHGQNVLHRYMQAYGIDSFLALTGVLDLSGLNFENPEVPAEGK